MFTTFNYIVFFIFIFLPAIFIYYLDLLNNKKYPIGVKVEVYSITILWALSLTFLSFMDKLDAVITKDFMYESIEVIMRRFKLFIVIRGRFD